MLQKKLRICELAFARVCVNLHVRVLMKERKENEKFFTLLLTVIYGINKNYTTF